MKSFAWILTFYLKLQKTKKRFFHQFFFFQRTIQKTQIFNKFPLSPFASKKALFFPFEEPSFFEPTVYALKTNAAQSSFARELPHILILMRNSKMQSREISLNVAAFQIDG